MNDEQFIDFLENEIARTKKTTRSTYISGLVISVLVGGYMAFILFMLQTFLEPQNLAMVIGDQVEEAGPEFIHQAEASLVAHAENMAQGFSDEFIRLVPEFAAEGRKQIDGVTAEYLPALSDEFSAVIREYVDEHAVELQSFAAEHSNKEFAKHFTDAMMAELAVQLDQRMKDNCDGRGVAYFNEHVLVSLLAIDETVTQLAEADPATLDRRQLLQRRILARLVATVVDEDED